MFRCVFLCVMFAVAQSQLTCIKMDATMVGGLCDGMKASLSVCALAGTPTTQNYPRTTGMDEVQCGTMQGMCAIGGGTAHKDFCAPGVTSGFCKQNKAILLSKSPTSKCSTDADCAKTLAPDLTVGCCADYKTVLGQMCTGIADLDAAVIKFFISLSLFCV